MIEVGKEKILFILFFPQICFSKSFSSFSYPFAMQTSLLLMLYSVQTINALRTASLGKLVAEFARLGRQVTVGSLPS